jgi:hypothetical protein
MDEQLLKNGIFHIHNQGMEHTLMGNGAPLSKAEMDF